MYIFPYRLKRIEEGIISDPRVDLSIETPEGFLSILFLFDSGADVTTLPLNRYAKILNFTPDPSRKITIGGVEGTGINAYPSSALFKLGQKVFPMRFYFIESSVDPLLGRLDFWNKFSINFDNKKRQTIINPI